MIQLAFVIGLSLTIPMTACAYTIEADPINFTGSASNELIVLHESGNERNLGPHSLDNEVAYETKLVKCLCLIFCRIWWTSETISSCWPNSIWRRFFNQKPMRKSNWLERIMRRHLKRFELARTNNAATFKKIMLPMLIWPVIWLRTLVLIFLWTMEQVMA